MARRDHTYVFLGPSLPVEEGRALCDAVFLPPAAVGDVYRLVRAAHPVRIAIIDGYFERMAAVWHKEILFALEQRIAVLGAASMGALRAAELAAFGMVGVGQVFAGYRAGRLTDDDEVAVAHLPAERGFTPASTAMVELRAGLALARRRRVITARDHDRLLELGKARFYRERSWPQLIGDGAAVGVARRPLDRLASLVAAEPAAIDVKAADARRLLRQLGRQPEVRPARPPWKLARTWFWDRFEELFAD